MKMTLSLLPGSRRALAAQAEQAVLERLPLDQKTLRRAAALMKPKNLKLLAAAAIGGGAMLSVLGGVARERLTRAAVSRELKRQLEPVRQQLDALEEQNEELKRQNEQLRALLTQG